MSTDEGIYQIEQHYKDVYKHFFNEDAVEPAELGIEHTEAEKMLDAMTRTGYLTEITRDEYGTLYSCEHFGIEEHTELLEEFNL